MDKQDFLKKLSQAKKSKLPVRTVILIHRDAICEALNLGYSRKAIYDVLYNEGIYTSSYTAFTKALKRHIKPSYSDEASSLPVIPEQAAVAKSNSPVKTYRESKKPKKFSRSGDVDKLIGG